VAVEQTLSERTPSTLRDSMARDREAPVFQTANLARIARKAMAAGAFTTAAGVADLGMTMYPASPLFAELKSDALESSGAIEQAKTVASACAAMPSADDWRAEVAVRLCEERARRLSAP
jgi:hypothetical protein